MKRLLTVLFSFPLFVLAQNKPLVAEGIAPDLYVNHTVSPKENYYSIGRIYNISPKEIAPFNNLAMENGLSMNQVIKIPLASVNFLQDGNAANDEVLVPVYHIVQDKEGLSRVSANYNKLPVETIMKWNNLKSSVVASGTNLIVGYLKVKKDLSPLATMATTKPAGDINNTAAPVYKEPSEVAEKTAATTAANTPPANAPVENEKALAEPAKKDRVVVTTEAATTNSSTAPLTGKNFNGGIFKSDFEKQIKSREVKGESGEAAVFKSTSGWEDGKYYCLHNSSTPGTIIKITNNSTGKNVYAKVLDIIPDMKQNEGLLIRLSNAAASELGAGEGKFDCTLSYSK